MIWTLLMIAGVAALVVVAAYSLLLARRLDRLHRMLIADRHQLDGALVRRAAAASELATSGALDPAASLVLSERAGASLAGAGIVVADGLELSLGEELIDRDRARVETELSLVLRQLAATPDAIAELGANPLFADVVAAWGQADIYRTFHDARQARVARVRRKPLVRALRLSGGAAYPSTFDADLALPATLANHEGAADPDFEAEWPVGPSGHPERNAARLLLFDTAGRVLTILGHDVDDAEHRWWFTPGGGILPGETPAQAAARELLEETGIRLTPDQLIGPVARRSAEFRFVSQVRVQHEEFFACFLTGDPVAVERTLTAMEEDVLDEMRWQRPEELAERQRAGELVYPEDLPDFAAQLTAAGWDGAVRSL